MTWEPNNQLSVCHQMTRRHFPCNVPHAEQIKHNNNACDKQSISYLLLISNEDLK